MNQLIVGDCGSGKTEFVKKKLANVNHNIFLVAPRHKGVYEEVLPTKSHQLFTISENEVVTKDIPLHWGNPKIITFSEQLERSPEMLHDVVNKSLNQIAQHNIAQSQAQFQPESWEIVFDDYFDEDMLDRLLSFARAYHFNVRLTVQDIHFDERLLANVQQILALKNSSMRTNEIISELSGTVMENGISKPAITHDELQSLQLGQSFVLNNEPHFTGSSKTVNDI